MKREHILFDTREHICCLCWVVFTKFTLVPVLCFLVYRYLTMVYPCTSVYVSASGTAYLSFFLFFLCVRWIPPSSGWTARHLFFFVLFIFSFFLLCQVNVSKLNRETPFFSLLLFLFLFFLCVRWMPPTSGWTGRHLFFLCSFSFFLLCQVNASQFWLNSETRTWANATTAPMHAAVDLRDFSAQANKYRERIL